MSKYTQDEKYISDIICLASGRPLVDQNGVVLIDCVRLGHGWGTGFRECWISLECYDPSCDKLVAWDTVHRYKAGYQLAPYMY